MSIKSRLQADLRDALRARDETRKSVIRLTLAELVNAEIEQGGELDEASAGAVLQKEARKRQETITELREANRPELLRKEEDELAILEEYVPRQLTREEIAEEAERAIEAAGATGLAQLGSVMKVLMPTLKGRADGRLANEVVRELLAGH